jgi:phosphomannomutase
MLMILAQDLLARHPGALVLGDIKMGRALFDRVRAGRAGADVEIGPFAHEDPPARKRRPAGRGNERARVPGRCLVWL